MEDPEEDDSSNEKKAYSIQDIIQMKQDTIQEKVFTFNSSIKSLISREEYTEIQSELKSLSNMKGISSTNLPTFKFF